MKVLVNAHKYEVQNFENPETSQVISFIHKEAKEGSSDLITVSDGTTNEELLKVLIDRTENLQNKFPCSENEIALFNLKSALYAFQSRTFDRVKRNVEGKQLK